MTWKKKPLAFGSGVAVILGAGLTVFFLSHDKGMCFVREQFPARYDVTIDEQSSLEKAKPSPLGRPSDEAGAGRFQGQLLLWVENSQQETIELTAKALESGSSRIVGKFLPRSLQSGASEYNEFKTFQSPFELNFSKGCALEAVQYDGRESISSRRIIHRLVNWWDTSVKAGRTAGDWERKDEYGQSRFEVNKSESSQQQVVAQRTQVSPAVGELLQGMFVVAEVQNSQLLFQFPGSDQLMDFARIEERFLGQFKGDSESRVVNYSIEMAKMPWDSKLLSAQLSPKVPLNTPAENRYKVVKKTSEIFLQRDKTTSYDRSTEAERAEVQSLSYDEIRDQFLIEMEKDPVAAKKKLIAYLRQNPQALIQVRNELLADTFPSESLAAIAFVLSKVDVPEAHQVMADVINNTELTPNVRLRVIFASGDVSQPSPELVAALKDQTALRQNNKTDDLNSSVLLALGSVGRNAREVVPDVENEVRDFLSEQLKSARDETERANALDAMANFADPQLLPQVEGFLASASNAERAAAIQAVAQTPSALSEQKVAAALAKEADSYVIGQAFNAVKGMGIYQPSTVDSVKAAYGKTSNWSHKSQAIEAIGESQARVANANAALKDLVGQEKHSALIESAGRYLSASDIASILKKNRR